MTNPSDQTDQMLKACPTPWCTGERGEPYVFARRFDCNGVYCPECCVTTPYFKTEAEAIAAWNTRSPDSAVLVEALERIADESWIYDQRNKGGVAMYAKMILASFHKGVSDAG